MSTVGEARKDRAIKFLIEELKRITPLAKAQKSALRVVGKWTNWENVVATFEPQAVKETSPVFDHMLRDMLSNEPAIQQRDQAWREVIQRLVDTVF